MHNHGAAAAAQRQAEVFKAPPSSPLSAKPSLASFTSRGICGAFALSLFALSILPALASAVAVARGQEYSAAEAGSVAGYEGGRWPAGRTVSTMTQLWDKVSSGYCSSCNTGTEIMANGGTTTLTVGEYKCSDGTCASSGIMLETYYLYGAIQCLNDDASCVLDGESSRRGMSAYGTGSGKLTIRAIRFYKGKSSTGGGVYVGSAGKVDFTLCVFDSCEATSTYSSNGGGGIYVYSGNVNIYATTFTGNSAATDGDDIYRSSGTVTIHDTCPSPYSANTPTQGKYENRLHHITSL